jgi:hypothetical protein
MNTHLQHQQLPFLKKIRILIFENQGLMLSHQFKSQLDEDCQPVKWLNYETKALKSTTTTSLSQRMLELILFLLLRELGQISDSAAKT